jgi:two-component system, cell cycle sensor histidine kinase and response regulator CckA
MIRERNFLPGELQTDRYADLVRRLQSGEAGAGEELYSLFAGGVRMLLRRSMPLERADDEVRPLLMAFARALRDGTVREPEPLPRLVRIFVREWIQGHAEGSGAADIHARAEMLPEQAVPPAMLSRDREILTRFYAWMQPVDQICRDLRITARDVEIVTATARAQFDERRRRRAQAHPAAPRHEPERKVLRVLQVEDSETDAAWIVRLLEKAGHAVEAARVENAEEMLQALGRGAWDVIIADHRLPRFDAPAALALLQESGWDIPFIVVSGAIDAASAVALMKAGASDYVLKDNLARLAPAVERELREAEMRRERLAGLQALQEEQERLALAIRAAQLGAFDLHPTTRKLTLSEHAARHFGLAAEAKIAYEVFLRAVHPNDRERVDQLVRHALRPESGGQYATEYRTVGLEDGKERWLASFGHVFFDAERRPLRFTGVTLDITERQRRQEELRQMQRLESISRVAGGVAHEFNNLLTVIGGGTQVVADALGPGDPLQETMRDIWNAVQRAGDLTRQLLVFSRCQRTTTRPIALNDLVRGSEKRLRQLIGDRIQLVFRLGEGAGKLRGDPEQLQQVLVNLAANARDAMPGGGRLTLATSRRYVDEALAAQRGVRPGTYVALVVRDSGVGMAPEVQARVFEPFFTTKAAGKAAGLGLATTYGIVRQSDGAIWVHSQPGKGSTFTMWFPALEADRSIPVPLAGDKAR